MTKLSEIQQKLKAPKNQVNKFGGYNYRSNEDILEAVKPLLGDATLTVTDEIVLIGDRYYVKATATFKGEDEATTTAYAREAESKKGMDESQITGSASSYARKYALNGLFCIDDNKDPDATNDHGKGSDKKPEKKPEKKTEKASEGKTRLVNAIARYAELHGSDKSKLMQGIAKRPDYQPTEEFYNKVAEEFERQCEVK